MARRLRLFFWMTAALSVAGAAWPACADPPAPAETTPAATPTPSVEKLVERVRRSLVVVSFKGRDGEREGLGTGFVIDRDGLIATNLHVIGEARPIVVRTLDGRRHDVTTIEASDRAADLALLRVDAHDLTPLELGDSDQLKQGQPVVAMGNPHGLINSVVTGVVSGQREIDGRQMIQLAIPIEPGNSGGPLLDFEGRVHGLLTMKSLVTANLGFAVPINRLKPLIEKPNPIAIDRWLLMGGLEPSQWTTHFGARWRQRAGRILVEGSGDGFGGRSLCLSREPVPDAPFDVAVTVRLDDESGAAGLVFSADGGDRHFGFYPSAGKLRLTQFDGPDVTSWQVLDEQPSTAYVRGAWNTLKVRIERDRVLCHVNGELVIESSRAQPNPGRVGLAKFRDTRAEFKDFQMAKEISAARAEPEVVERIDRLLADRPDDLFDAATLREFAEPRAAAMLALRERAKRLDRQAEQLRQLANAVHEHDVLSELRQEIDQEEPKIDLFHAALLIARLDSDEVDVEAYRQQLSRMADELKGRLPAEADDETRLKALNTFLFADSGFHGSRGDYYNRRNSYVNEVLDDREGLPITLSVLYIELARRLDLDVVGIGLPGHFVVEFRPKQGERRIIDVFEQGEALTRQQVDERVRGFTGQPPTEEQLRPVDKRAILVRILRNLQSIAGRRQDMPGVVRYLDAILAIMPDSGEDRMFRAFYRYQSGHEALALEDLDWLMEHRPTNIDFERVGQLRESILRRKKPSGE